jgi:hypothetical protein
MPSIEPGTLVRKDLKKYGIPRDSDNAARCREETNIALIISLGKHFEILTGFRRAATATWVQPIVGGYSSHSPSIENGACFRRRHADFNAEFPAAVDAARQCARSDPQCEC